MGLFKFYTLKFHSVSKTHPVSDLHMWLLNNTLVADVFFFCFVFLPNHTPKKRWLHVSLNSTTPGLLIYAVLVEIKTQNKCCGAISPEIKNPFPNLLMLPCPHSPGPLWFIVFGQLLLLSEYKLTVTYHMTKNLCKVAYNFTSYRGYFSP